VNEANSESPPADADILEAISAQFGGTVDSGVVHGCTIAGVRCNVFRTMDGGFGVTPTGDNPYRGTDLARFARMAIGMPVQPPPAANDNTPVDLWAERQKPSMPKGLLPPIIEAFSRWRATQMGVDAGGLAVAALAVCAAALPDRVKLQVKRNDPDWTESARLWVALVGAPSTKKSPTIATAARPLRQIDGDMVTDYLTAMAEHARLPKADRAVTPPPTQKRVMLEDTTVEATQEVLRDNPAGVLLLRDELTAWFGSMERYGSTKSAMADRGFWLQTFNGGPHTTNRIGRGLVHVPNLSVSLLGGIQPEPIRAIAEDMQDDGLLQRLIPVVLGSASVGSEEPSGPASEDYTALVRRLRRAQPPRGPQGDERVIRFSDGAQAVRNELEERHLSMSQAWEMVNRKFGAHLGKYDAIFARICLVFHAAEADSDHIPEEISADTAHRAGEFLHRFLFRHAVAFYGNVLGLADDHDRIVATAGHILAKGLTTIAPRDVYRGDRTMRGATPKEAAEVLERLELMGWLEAMPPRRMGGAPEYRVNPAVHRLFEERAADEAERRAAIGAMIAQAATSDCV
jgi:hypothetical protein